MRMVYKPQQQYICYCSRSSPAIAEPTAATRLPQKIQHLGTNASIAGLSAFGLPGAAALLRLRLLQHGLVVLLIHGHCILWLHDSVNQAKPACPSMS